MRKVLACVFFITFDSLLQAAVIDTTNPAVISAFQSGATVQTFESISGRTAQPITAYTAGNPVAATSFLFDQISGVQFSVGGMVGTNEPAEAIQHAAGVAVTEVILDEPQTRK